MSKPKLKIIAIFSIIFFTFNACSTSKGKGDDTGMHSSGFSESEIIILGHYEQDRNSENGPEPIEWIVLKDKGEKALVISKDILEMRPFDAKFSASAGGLLKDSTQEKAKTNWEGSDIRYWLNSSFFATAFEDGAEKDRIICEDSGDRIFLLSEKDVGLIPGEYLVGNISEYCKGLGFDSSGWMLSGLHSRLGSQYVSIVGENGKILRYSAKSTLGRNGVRPAMWIYK